MQAFRYQHGDRPLEGYTIQRAVGRGGFGEVYYALSDSGREVALKVISGYEQIELRGVSQCMNLKSPHLVTIFDIRYSSEGIPFVIMEYVAGPSLRQLLDESPAGLGPQKAAFFLREIARGLSYLHERGIIHRDLKPGNIFYEDGYVKIGDYGLSKVLSASRHSDQTMAVGTVHYMAPEIGQGRYDTGIDIYALGCILYEMLTGQTPYPGATPGEILMKHMAGEPDLSGIEEPFAGVIRRALAKNPADRYARVQEMVEAVFGAEEVRNSVSLFRPENLSMVAERVGRKIAVGGSGSSAEHTGDRLGGGPPGRHGTGDFWEPISRHLDRINRQMADTGRRLVQRVEEFGTRLVGEASPSHPPPAPQTSPQTGDPVVGDPLTWKQRRILALITASLAALGIAYAKGSWWHPLPLFVVIAAAPAGLVGVRLRWMNTLRHESGFIQRLVFALAATGTALLFLLPAMVSSALRPSTVKDAEVSPFVFVFAFAALFGSRAIIRAQARRLRDHARNELGGWIYFLPILAGSVLTAWMIARSHGWAMMWEEMSFALLSAIPVLLLLDWRTLTSPWRPDRVSPGAAIWAGLLGWLCGELLNTYGLITGGTLAGLCLTAQILSPWDPIAARDNRARRQAGRPLKYEDSTPATTGGCRPPDPAAEKITPAPTRNVSGAVPIGAAACGHPPADTPMKTRGALAWSGRALRGFVVGICKITVFSLWLVGISCGLISALKLPELVAVGWPGPELAHEMEEGFGHAVWPRLVQQLAAVLSVALICLAGLWTVASRRHQGPAHVWRAVLGVVAILLAGATLSRLFAPLRWSPIADLWRESSFGAGMAALFDQLSNHASDATVVLLLLCAAVILLIWPVRPREDSR